MTHSSGSLLFSSNTQVRFPSVLRGARVGAVGFHGVPSFAAGLFIPDPDPGSNDNNKEEVKKICCNTIFVSIHFTKLKIILFFEHVQ
jgi:hypothetical protein